MKSTSESNRNYGLSGYGYVDDKWERNLSTGGGGDYNMTFDLDEAALLGCLAVGCASDFQISAGTPPILM